MKLYVPFATFATTAFVSFLFSSYILIYYVVPAHDLEVIMKASTASVVFALFGVAVVGMTKWTRIPVLPRMLKL
ncbi:MAG: hypothetical protein NTX72_03035 [Candidatus Uhrbacteria bacterium]|nr:hypothetical protein [Candidatus Uhrbacteria bacterium]